MIAQIVRGPLLVPRVDGSVGYFADGALAADEHGILVFVGDFSQLCPPPNPSADPSADPSREGRDVQIRPAIGVIIPPLIDIHLHIPQHPIRGHFVDGIPDDAPGGKLLNGLKENVFPAEAKCHDPLVAKMVVDAFAQDTLSHGVVGGCAYMMVNARATDIALATLPDSWSVGMVLMNQNAPEDLVTNEPTLEHDIEQMVRQYGSRAVITDRFAVAVDSRLRQRASRLASRFGLRTQTHLNEQVAEKNFVERELYPDLGNYTTIYLEDGLLDHRCILAHCIHMRAEEWSLARDTGSVIAHCPTSNLLLESGTMNLDEVIARQIPYAIATDVGASPTVSMLAEMGRFLEVHKGISAHATPAEALCRATLAPAKILGIDDRVGDLSVGKPMSFIEVQPREVRLEAIDAADVIRSLLPADLNAPANSVNRVTLAGKTAYDRGATDA